MNGRRSEDDSPASGLSRRELIQRGLVAGGLTIAGVRAAWSVPRIVGPASVSSANTSLTGSRQVSDPPGRSALGMSTVTMVGASVAFPQESRLAAAALSSPLYCRYRLTGLTIIAGGGCCPF